LKIIPHSAVPFRNTNFPGNFPLSEWFALYTYQLSAPDDNLKKKYEEQLEKFLKQRSPTGLIVSLSVIERSFKRFNWKASCGIDKVSAMHLTNGEIQLRYHLALLMQMIFTQGVVPSFFCIGDLTPIPKKGKLTALDSELINVELTVFFIPPSTYINYPL
jgi:hypothetical protein